MIIDPQSKMVSLSRTYVNSLSLVLTNPQVIKHSAESADSPPSYDYVAAQATSSLSSICFILDYQLFTIISDVGEQQPPLMNDKNANQQVQLPSIPPNTVMAVHSRPAPLVQQPIVYHYQNPLTGERIASLLPPDHPEMICLQQGAHVNETKFGILGREYHRLTGSS